MTKDEALKQVLEAITQYLAESPDPSEEAVEGLCDAASVARKALAQPEQEPFSPESISVTHTAWKMGYEAAKVEQEQEPVVWVEYETGNRTQRPQNCGTGYCSCIECVMEPPQRTWVDLTDEQRINISYKADGNECVAVELTEAKLKELNHG